MGGSDLGGAGDVEFWRGWQRNGAVDGMGKLLDAGRDIILQILDMEKPVIASVNGVAAGAGCNLALACDYRIASDQAKRGETFVRIGLHPDWGGTWLLPRLVGRSRALEIMMTGRMVEAAEALDDVVVFHAGTTREADGLPTAVGRVPGVTATGATLQAAAKTLWQAGSFSVEAAGFARA